MIFIHRLGRLISFLLLSHLNRLLVTLILIVRTNFQDSLHLNDLHSYLMQYCSSFLCSFLRLWSCDQVLPSTPTDSSARIAYVQTLLLSFARNDFLLLKLSLQFYFFALVYWYQLCHLVLCTCDHLGLQNQTLRYELALWGNLPMLRFLAVH